MFSTEKEKKYRFNEKIDTRMGSPCAQPGWAWRKWKSRNFNSWISPKTETRHRGEALQPLALPGDASCCFFQCKVRGKMGKLQHLKLVGALKHFCLAIFGFSQVCVKWIHDRTSVRLGRCCTLILQVESSSQKCEL